jgi:DNA repair photolyase
MTPSLSPFAGLTNVTFQLITTCNLSCDYCFQDACNVSSSPQGGNRGSSTPLIQPGF